LLRHVARLVAPLVVDYFTSRRLVVDYLTYATRPVASTCRAACRVTHRRLLRLSQARCRLFHIRRASGCFSTSRDLSRDSTSTTSPRAGSSSTTSPTPRVQVPWLVAGLVTQPIVDYFDYDARPGASAHRAAHRATRRRLLRLRARVRLLQHVARHIAWLVAPLVVDYFASCRLVVDYFTYAPCPVASARRAACHVTHHRLLRLAQARH
jgi:hypothetical protein